MQLLSTLAALPVAQWQPGPHGPGPHGPHWGGGPMGPVGPMGPGGPGMGSAVGPIFGGWWLVLLFALLVVGLVVAAFYLTRRDADAGGAGEDGALAVLRERYAAGDLDEEEFERRRERLAG